jgi:hypothetical protein
MAGHVRVHDVHHWVTGQLAEIEATARTPGSDHSARS